MGPGRSPNPWSLWRSLPLLVLGMRVSTHWKRLWFSSSPGQRGKGIWFPRQTHVVALRRDQQLSNTQIEQCLRDDGLRASAKTILKVLCANGFPKLPNCSSTSSQPPSAPGKPRRRPPTARPRFPARSRLVLRLRRLRLPLRPLSRRQRPLQKHYVCQHSCQQKGLRASSVCCGSNFLIGMTRVWFTFNGRQNGWGNRLMR